MDIWRKTAGYAELLPVKTSANGLPVGINGDAAEIAFASFPRHPRRGLNMKLKFRLGYARVTVRECSSSNSRGFSTLCHVIFNVERQRFG